MITAKRLQWEVVTPPYDVSARWRALSYTRWGRHVFSEEPLNVAYSLCTPSSDMSLLHAEKLVKFCASGSAITHEVFVRGVKISMNGPCEPASLLEAVDAMPVCSGASLLCEFPFASSGKNLKVWNGKLYQHKCKGTSSKDERRCMSCKYLRKLLVNQRYRKKQAAGKLTRATKLKAKAQTVRRLRNKVKTLDQTIAQLKLENEEIEEGALLSKIDKLPSKQKNAIMQCFEAARRKSLNGMRYNPEWTLECVIMHMKSPRLYEHVRREKILVLPSRTCLRAFMKKYDTCFGFNKCVLSGISKKTANMGDFERHGGLIIDEMKLAENFGVQRGSGKVDGFVDLGSFTPEADKSVPCDHGLVIMFQPLSGSWHQILGVFASRGNVKAPLLSKIILEAVVLAENAGLRVDYVTSDGASWNRAMWHRFGVSGSASSYQAFSTSSN